jgi:peptide deformylase
MKDKKIIVVGDSNRLTDIATVAGIIANLGIPRVVSMESKPEGILDIIKVLDPILYKSCAPVEIITEDIKRLAKGMLFTLQHIIGDPQRTPIGLSAPQVGELIQVFVINHPNITLTAINPRVTKVSDNEHSSYECCLSIPGKVYVVKRPKIVKFKCLDMEGKERTYKFHDLLAAAALHEIEHLSGITLENTGRVIA